MPLTDSSQLMGTSDRSNSISRTNFSPSPNSIVHKRILQTEARIQGKDIVGVVSPTQYTIAKGSEVNQAMKANQAMKEKKEPKHGLDAGLSDHSKKSSRSHHSSRRHSEKSHGVPRTINVGQEADKLGDKTNTTYHLDLLKDKKLKSTRPKEETLPKVPESSDLSVSSSRERLERLGTLLTKARGNCQSVQTRISSLVEDASMVESNTTEEIQTLLQDNKDLKHRQSYAGTETKHQSNAVENNTTANEISRLKARLATFKSEKTNRAAASLTPSASPNVVESWMMDPPPSPQTRSSDSYLNRLVSKETRYIKTEYQESESKTDDNGVKVQSRLCSHVQMAVQQSEIGSSDALLDDPMIRLVLLARELADQASKIDFLPFNNEACFPRMNPRMLRGQESFARLEASQDKTFSGSHLAFPPSPNGTLPPMDYLLRKLQETEEQCLELTRTKEALEASLMEANNFRRDLELNVNVLTEELEEARATNTSLTDEIATTREEVATFAEGNTKLEEELERTQNRLGDVVVQVSDLELESASLRQMVDEKDKEIDGNMSLLKDQHKTVVGVMDNTREIRRLMMELREKLRPKSYAESDESAVPINPEEAWEDWLKQTIPQMDSMENALTACRSQLAVKIQIPDEENENESDTTKKGWSLFRFGR